MTSSYKDLLYEARGASLIASRALRSANNMFSWGEFTPEQLQDDDYSASLDEFRCETNNMASCVNRLWSEYQKQRLALNSDIVVLGYEFQYSSSNVWWAMLPDGSEARLEKSDGVGKLSWRCRLTLSPGKDVSAAVSARGINAETALLNVLDYCKSAINQAV